MENNIEQTLKFTADWLKDINKQNLENYKSGLISKKKYKKNLNYLRGYSNCLVDIHFQVHNGIHQE